ncbi:MULTISPECIES: hypothetical protein [unclassified Sphingomonas]|uniref:hypothetical protein n=1 Tax=unclassified Sphingomonas TaxID=196159 RepID=UPI000925C2BE|nr:MULTISPECIES: hypothetical protein [unclassified Sphingomonas]MBN8849882.1 hypothetical protein [Sphingomonas sp.]OJV31634.1 MAG: hypothetical protein BGO24_05520 [Sphingomonas sp. 67-36]
MSDTDYTVGELRRCLEGISDDTKLSFGGGMTVYRIKQYAGDEVYLEWNEPFAFLDEKFRKNNPHIKVAFVDLNAADFDESGLLGSVDVSIR